MAFNFDKIKGLFVVSEDEKKKNPPPPPKKEAPKKKVQKHTTKASQINYSKSNVETSNSFVSSEGKLNQRVFESLTKAIHKANLPGEDYLEFIDALQAMKNIPLDEKIKMQTVLATLSTKGLTIQKIMESADYYMKVLENEKDKFNKALVQQTEGQVNAKMNEAEALKKAVVEKTKLIQTLTADIAQLQGKINQVNNQISKTEAKIKNTEKDFLYTWDMVANQIKTNLQKIKQLI